MQTNALDGDAMARTAKAVLLVVVDASVLVATTSTAAQLPAEVTDPSAWVAQIGSDRAVVALAQSALWLAACWLALVLAAAFLSCAPGLSGTCGRLVVHRAMPRTLRIAVLSSIGLSIVLPPALVQAAPIHKVGRARVVTTMPVPTPAHGTHVRSATPARTRPRCTT